MIVVNARFLTHPVTGVERFSLEILRELKHLRNDLDFVCPKNIVQTEAARELGARPIGNLTGHLWEQLDLPLYLAGRGFPFLLNLANTAPLFYRKQLVTVHDIAFERYPDTFSKSFRVAYHLLIPRILRHSKKAVTVSEFSKHELSEFYHIPPEKIGVIYNSVRKEFFKPGASVPRTRTLIAVGSLHAQKNIASMIEAFSGLPDDSLRLKIIGGSRSNFQALPGAEKWKDDPRIEFPGRLSDDELLREYQSALGFVMTSFYEGFGIPPLEAQACGCPVLVSKAASLPEVFGDSALYCDPASVEDIRGKMKELISNDALRGELSRKGILNVARYDWGKSAAALNMMLPW